ncbi:MAG TPA: hypothetical protein VEC12_13030 [Bacteroidia bacterium]|nr:hypothetical protein [Bacteroidia bacterium]
MLLMIAPALSDVLILSVIFTGLLVVFFDLKGINPFKSVNTSAKNSIKGSSLPGFTNTMLGRAANLDSNK